MITAVDTNNLLDLLVPGSPDAQRSERTLVAAAQAGAIILSEPVYAELAAWFPDRRDLDGFLADTGIRLEPSSPEALALAGQAWREYSRTRRVDLECPACGNAQAVRCDRCGRRLAPRQHVVADFMIGAHAQVGADRLATRDRRYYGRYLPKLRLVS